MNADITISLDAMGGDHGPEVVVHAALMTLKRHPGLKLILVGDETVLQQTLTKLNADVSKFLTIHHASQVVGMDEKPSSALRTKKDSSMRVAINLVKEGIAQAIVSAGNTGALMATARFVLKTLPGVDRPAICTTLPTVSGHTYVLDLGANVDSSAEHLFEFAVMGAELASAVEDKKSPTVGLLNIGEEEVKGNEQVKDAARLLAASNLNYIGYVEGDGIYLGHADVVVCDGFVGNVMLKSSEGVAKMISQFIKKEFKRNILTMLSGLIALPILRAFKKRFDPREYNGASLVGLQGIVIKSHGGADAVAFSNAINEAVLEIEKNVPARIRQQLENILVKERLV
ncbi:MAG: phosphate acyltransferase PlsX [Gammaproteobacteria bacterium]|nr:phosphate acyltransferase PlsX [Gammaproteobacteria bacterium]MDH5652674.1 phosphate acyltransferase PlsX [Gammaproteobacteria bacterium]